MKSPLLRPLNAQIKTSTGLTRWVPTLALLALLVSFSQAGLQAQNYVVNSSSDANSGTGLTGTLRYCITQANAAPGVGLRTITFTVPFVDFNTDYPQIVKPMLIDGGPSKVIIKDPTPSDAAVRPFFLNAGSSGSTIRNLEVRGGGSEPIRIDGSPTNITIRNFSCNNIGGVGNNWNYGIFINGNASGYVIDNVVLRDIQTNYHGIWIDGTATNLTIDSLKIPDGLYGSSEGIHIGGAATNVSITNTYIDGEDQSLGGNEGDYIIYFASNVTGLTMTNDTFLDPGYAALRVRGTLTNFNMSNSRIVNTYGHHGAVGLWVDGAVNGFTVNNVFMDMDCTTEHPTNNGDYGIYITANVTNLNIDNLTVRDADLRAIYIAGVTTTAVITNSTFDKKLNGFGGGGSEMIRFNGAVSGLTMTNVDINGDIPGVTDDAQYGIYIDGAVTNSAFNDVWINEADVDGIRIVSTINTTTFTNMRIHNSGGQGMFFSNTVRNTTITGSRIIKSGARGIYFDGGGSVFMNVDIVNTRIDSSGTAGVEAYFYGTGANADMDFTGDTITYSGEDGILVRWPNGDSDVSVTGCVLAHNGRTSTAGDGIQVQNLSKVMITQNSIYDNAGQGINLNGTGNCSLDPHDPVINTIINNGGGSYTVNFTIPAAAAAAGGTFTLEFFTNDAFSGAEGEHFAHTAAGYAVGTHNITFTTTTGPAANPKLASLTMTYTRVGSSCFGTSEFSNALGLDPQGPGCVDLGIRAWYRADKFFDNYSTGQDVGLFPDNSGNGNIFKQWTIGEQPKYFSGDASTNFNPSITFDGVNDNLDIATGIVPINTSGGTLLSAAYHANAAGTWAVIYDQNVDDPSLFKDAGTGYMRFLDNGNINVTPTVKALQTNVTGIRGFDYGTAANTTNLFYDGIQSSNYGGTASPVVNIGYIGGRNTAFPWNGKIHELIFYNRELNATERQKINTYLSIKWGVSIDTTIMKVPGLGNNYITGDETVIWTANNSYYHRIAGIGRDDCDSLLQKQSRNVNLTSPGYVTIGLGTIAATNAANANTIAADKNFMVWGDNGKAGSGTTTITDDGVTTLMGGTCSQYSRLAKTYRVQETGTIGVVQLQFNMTGVKLGKTVNDYYLAIHTSDVFSGTIEKLVAPTSYDNTTGILVFDNVNFASNEVRYFTVVGKRVYGPANITANLKLWLKAEDGIAADNGDPMDIWGDQGPAGNDVTQATLANQPLYNKSANLINFNPSVKFDGANDELLKANGVLTNATVYTGATLFSVNNSQNSAAAQRMFRQIAASNRDVNLYAPYANRTIFDAGYPDRLDIVTTLFSNKAFNITTGVKDNSGANTPAGLKQVYYNNGKSIDTGTGTLTYTGNNGNLSIGSGNGIEFHNGYLGEIIYYSAALTATERQKVNSYLSLKWGVSLDQTTPYDYLGADGAVIWDATTNATYKNRITGIGRDDCSDLIQRQSRNQDTTSAFATIGLGTIAATNIANTNNFSVDKSFLIWGDDNVAGATTTTVTGDGTITLNPGSCGVFRRLAKTFAVQKTGTVGMLQIKVNLRGVTLGKVASDHYLAIHNSATFTGVITKLIPATSYAGGILTFDNVILNDEEYFTVIGKKAQGPANLTTNLRLWLRADDGITLNGSTVEGWTDQGPAANDAVQATVANQPIFNDVTNLINFNPTLSFNGTNSWLRTGANVFGTGNISYTTFGIVDHTGVAGNRYYLADGPAAGSQAAWFGHQGALQAQANWANDLASGPVAINIPYLEGFTRDGSTNTKTNYQSAKLMGSNTLAAINKTNNGWGEIGANTINTEIFNGKIGEIISFQSVLNALEQQKVYSYLAVKWGFTLDQTTPYDYVSATGTTIWNATTYATFKNRITGIGRDDCSDLIQKQSKSVETGALVTVSNGSALAVTNDANPSSFGADNTWMLFGDNNKGVTWTGSGVPINGGNVRLNRVWRVAETGTVGVVYLEVPDNTSALTTKLPATTTSIYLLVANSGTNGKFSALSGVTVQQMTFDATNKKWYTTYNFTDGDYFTFGSEKICIAPVGISEGLTTWYHATDLPVASAPATLSDLAFGVYPLTKAGTANVVAGSATSFNYNRSMTLTAGSYSRGALTNTDVIDASAGSMMAVGTTNANLFAISSTAMNSSGLLNPSAQFNGTNGTYGAGIASKPNIFTMIGSIANVKGYTNGTVGITSGSIAARAAGAYTLGLGKNGSNAGSYTGSIAEAFSFDRVLDPEEKDILESYLAIKYGQTLSHNYFNADYDGSNAATTTVYDISTYPNRVFGIGTDTTGCFYQKQSTSVLAGSMLKMSLGTSFAAENSGNTEAFLMDRSYVMAGDDDGAVSAWVAGGGANPNTPDMYGTTCVLPTRINRQWKVTGTYVTPTILFAIPDATSSEATKLPAVTAGYSVWMVINNNPDFGVNDFQEEFAMTLNGATLNWEAQYQVPAGATKYITFVMKNDAIATGATGGTIIIAETDNSCILDDGKVTSGASALLTPTTGTAYVWSTGPTTPTLTVNPTMTTTYTVTVTQANGCTSSASSTITVVATPTAAIAETDASCTADDSKVISGDPATLTASGGATYAWDDLSTSAVLVVNPLMTTTYTVTVSDIDGCTASATATITVVTAPSVSLVGSDSICIGDMTSVSPVSGGTWSSSDPSVATVTDAGVVTGVSAGSVTFNFTATSTGCISASTPLVTVNPTPVVSISGSNNICVGSTTTLSPNTGGTWASNSPAVATVDALTGVVTGVTAGTATFTFTNSTTGCVSAPTAAVTINALPVVSIIGMSTICAGATTTLSPSTGGTWVSSNPAVASVTNAGLVTGLSGGTAFFTFTKTAAPNCSATTATVTVNALPVVSIDGASTICVGATTTLSPVSGGTWVSNQPSRATVTNAGLVTAVSAGGVTFTFTNTATGCVATTSSVTVDALPVVSITGANSICAGSTTTLSPTSGGTWVSSAPAVATVDNAGLVTGVSAGTATFTFTSSTSPNCTSLPTAAVSITALPVVSITGMSTICVGSTTTLSPTSGGTWVSSAPAIATVTNAGVVTGISAGSATFTFTSSSSPNCSATTSAVTLLAQPAVSITGASTICVGATTTLSPSTGGTWLSSNPAVATVTDAGVVTGVTAGSATFTFTDSGTGCISLATSAVTVNALPVVSITGMSSICVGFGTTLSPTTGGIWASSNASVATVTNAGVVTGISAGTATFTFTNSLTGCASMPTATVTVNAIPVVTISGATSICIGDNSGLTPTSGGTWASSNAAVATVDNAGVVTGVSAGTATFTFTETGTGCVSAPTAAITVSSTPVALITGASSICIGGTTTMLPTGGTWTSSNPAVATITNAGIVTGISAGTATFTFTSGTTGCQSAPSSSVTINAPPVVSITGSSNICVGSTTVLSPTSGGTWLSSDPGVATVTNAGLVTGVSAGLATFTFTSTTTGCVSAATSPVIVNPLPVVNISGPNTICVGFTTGLSPSTGGTWASSNAAVATVTDAGVVTGVSAGTATFTFTNTATGCVSAATGTVTVYAIPAVSITGANSICVGATTTLSPASGGTWVSTNPGVATVTNAGVVTAVSAGTSTFIFTSSSTGCVSVATGTVTVTSTPIVSVTGPSSICIGATTGLSPSSGGTWASSNASVATVTNAGVVTAVSAGTATFTFTDASGCVSMPTTAVTVNPTPTVSITGGNTICVGMTTTLSPSSGGAWVSSAPGVASVTSGGVVTGVSGGTATFTFTNTATGCVSAATLPVTVNPLPIVSITGGTSICVGATTNLSPTTGGTWTSSNAGIATVTNAGVVTGVSAGTVNFTFTNSVTGCVSATTPTVTVNPLPVVSITGAANICVGATTTVSPTTGGTWVSSNPAVASVTGAGLVTGLTAGSVTFTFTNTTTGCVSAATSAVTVHPIPVVFITGSSSICIGNTTTLSPTTGGTWTSSNPAVATVTNAGLVTGVSAGSVTFTFTNTTTGCVSLATSTVTVNAAPVGSITGVSSICVAATTTLSPNSGGTWSSSNAAVATVTNAGVVTGVSAGTATFTFTNSVTGCSSAATSPVTVNATPIVSITGANNICVGATTSLSPASGGTWSSSNPAVATVTSGGVVTGVSAGTASFTFTLTATGCASAPTSPVTVNALPVATITGAGSICIGSTTTLSPTSGGTWTSSAPAVATVTNGGVVTALSAGTVTFSFTSSTTGCTSAASAVVTVAACNSLVAVKAFLGGAYNAGVDLMNDDLRLANLIPTPQPYGGVQYTDFNYSGTETIGGGVLAVSGVDAIVDWVLLELRSASNPATVIARKAALIQRDGDVVESSDGISPVTFIGAPAGNYYVSIRHRNHLGVMTSAAVTLSGIIGTPVNFTSAATGNYQLAGPSGSSHAQRTLANSKRALWEGNMSNTSSSGNQVQYQGNNSDSDEPYFRVLTDPGNITIIPNYIVISYDRADGNLDGRVIYQGSDSDSDIPFFEVYTFPDNILYLPNFIIFQQIP